MIMIEMRYGARALKMSDFKSMQIKKSQISRIYPSLKASVRAQV